MRILWILGIILVGCVVWIWFHRTREGFTWEREDPTRPTSFEDQRDYFHYQRSPLDNPGMLQVNPGIFMGPSALRKSDFDLATKTPGYTFDPSSAANGIAKFLNTTVAEENLDDLQCRNASRPSNLKGDTTFMTERARKGEGCGWWFVENLYTPSTGAFGKAPTLDEYGVQTDAGGPTDPTIRTQFPGGRWIWNLDEAEQREHIKRCKRIQNCDLISSSDDCAFCPSKGYAVPIANGVLKYPNDEEGNCGDLSTLVSDSSRCPPLVIQPRLTNYDYDYDRNGNVVAGANSDALLQVGQTLEFVCAASPLTKECRLAMCKELAGCTEGRGLHRIVQQDGALQETDRLALQYLSQRGRLGISNTFLQSGTMPKTEAMDLMRRIEAMSMSSTSGIAKAAAKWLRDETPFDVCQYADGDTGPFPLECLQREFRKAGCQASGAGYPSDPTAFAGSSFGTIKTQFRDLFQRMNDTQQMQNVREQDEAVRSCLGISMVRSADETWMRNPNLCRDPGVEYWIYSIPQVGTIRMIGRMITPTILTEETGSLLQQFLDSAQGNRGYTARTFLDVGDEATTLTLQLPTNELYDNYSVYVNGVRAQHLSAIELPTKQRNKIELRFETPRGAFGSPRLLVQPGGRMVLNQSAWKPFVALEPRQSVFIDTNEYLDVQTADLQRFGTRAGLVVRQQPLAFSLTRQLTFPLLRTITCMFYWSTLNGQATVFQLDQGRGGTADTVLAFRIVEKFPTFLLQSSRGLYQFRSPTALGSPNQWVHVAIVLGTEASVWINGVEVVDPLKKQAFGGAGSFFTRLVFGSPGFEGGIGWFHIYDRRLTRTEIQRDQRYDDPSLSDRDIRTEIVDEIPMRL